MKPKRLPLPTHPLTEFFLSAVESVTTSLGDASVTSYRGTARLFLTYLGAHYPAVRSLDQLRRDPHILGWLASLRSHNPPLATATRVYRVIYLRCMLDELAWTQQLPALAHLLRRDDIPRKERPLPRPLTPEQDQLVQRELLRRDDLLSNALLLLRHTGMRIGECVDLSVDCLRPLGPNQWAIHVPLGKLKTERWVPVDSMVCQLVERILALRPPTAPNTGRLLLFGPRGRVMLIRRLRAAPTGCRGGGRNYREHRPAPISTHLRHGDATRRRRLCRRHATSRSQEPAHDLGVSRNHPTGSAARIPPGALSPKTFGAISGLLLCLPAAGRSGQPDRLAGSRTAHLGNVPTHPCRRLPAPSSRSPCQTSR
jgi:integrase